jgi:curved DNA-binding protein CbpA
MTYFNNIENLETLKKEFRQLAFEMHPDKGGNEEHFKAMLNEYENLKERIESGLGLSDNEKNNSILEDEKYKNALNAIINLEGIEIELIGSWLWISGNTYPVRAEIKAAGFLWASSKKMWFFRTEENKSRNKLDLSIDQIREMHKSTKIEKPNQKKLGKPE